MVAVLFFYYHKITEVMVMKDYIARLIKCGMPRDVAVCIVRQYAKRNDWINLESYVYSVEEETKYREEEPW